MVRETIGRLLDRFESALAVGDTGDRIDGSGQVYIDPTYNGRYAAERELRRLSAAEEENDDR